MRLPTGSLLLPESPVLKCNFNDLNIYVTLRFTMVCWMLWLSRFQEERKDQGREPTVPSMIVPLPQSRSQIWRSFFAISVIKDAEWLGACRLEISLSYVNINQVHVLTNHREERRAQSVRLIGTSLWFCYVITFLVFDRCVIRFLIKLMLNTVIRDK